MVKIEIDTEKMTKLAEDFIYLIAKYEANSVEARLTLELLASSLREAEEAEGNLEIPVIWHLYSKGNQALKVGSQVEIIADYSQDFGKKGILVKLTNYGCYVEFNELDHSWDPPKPKMQYFLLNQIRGTEGKKDV